MSAAAESHPWPTRDVVAMVARLGIRPNDRVLDVGGAANPFPRADVVCDLALGASHERNGAPTVLHRHMEWVESAGERLPFKDQAFDWVWCTHVLEHVRDPVAVAAELQRVARCGFIELPSRVGEMLSGNPSHRWIVDAEDLDGRAGEGLVFHPRTFLEHPLDNRLYGTLFREQTTRARLEGVARGWLNHQLVFSPDQPLRVRTVPAPKSARCFDYDDPAQSLASHYSFARNLLAAGADPEYGFPDAREVARRAPHSRRAQHLWVAYLVLASRHGEARAVLERSGFEADQALIRHLEGLEAGELLDPAAFPLPPRTLEGEGERLAPRPEVSLIVLGEEPEALLAATESALVQDWPRVQVLVVGPVHAESPGFARLDVEGRLLFATVESCDSPETMLAAARPLVTGRYVAFCTAGDTLMAHHVDRLVAELGVRDSQGVLSDRFDPEAGEVVPNEPLGREPLPSASSLSGLMVWTSWLLQQPAPPRRGGLPGLRSWLRQLAQEGDIEHLREATVLAPGAAAPHPGFLSEVQSRARLDPAELTRQLFAALEAGRGLQMRVQRLEAELADRNARAQSPAATEESPHE